MSGSPVILNYRCLGEITSELKVKGNEGIVRAFYCTKVGKRIIMLHGFIKKSPKTPTKKLRKAQQSLREVKNEPQ